MRRGFITRVILFKRQKLGVLAYLPHTSVFQKYQEIQQIATTYHLAVDGQLHKETYTYSQYKVWSCIVKVYYKVLIQYHSVLLFLLSVYVSLM